MEPQKASINVDSKLLNALLDVANTSNQVMSTLQQKIGSNVFMPIGQDTDEGYENIHYTRQDEIEEYQERLEKSNDDRAFEGLIIIVLFSFFCLILLTAYIGIAWHNFTLIHGYPSLAVPQSPNEFVSQRYTFMYFCVFMLVINYLPNIALLIVANIPNKITGIFLHKFATFLAFVVNIFSFISLLMLWVFFCNGEIATMSVLANDAFWCCVHRATAPLLCPIPICIAGAPTTRKMLHAPLEYILSIVAGVVFFLLSWAHLQINGSIGSWGLWRTTL